jgi:RNA polymerase sigma factor (sigma-70 family)
MLTFQEEVTLVNAWRATGDTKARDRLFREYRPLIESTAAKRRRLLEREDAKQAAYVGFAIAVDKVDHARARLSTIAPYYMWEELHKWETKSSQLATPYSRARKRFLARFPYARALWERDNQRAIDDEGIEKIAKEIEIERPVLEALIVAFGVGVSLDDTDDDEGGIDSGRDEAAEFQESHDLAAALALLDGDEFCDRDREIIRRRLDGETLGEIGSAMRVSRQRVEQLENVIIEKMRERLRVVSEGVGGEE